MAHLGREAIKAVLAGLSAEAEQRLLHVLDCTRCRDLALGRLETERRGDARPTFLAPAVAPGPSKAAAKGVAGKHAERLLAELLNLDPRQRHAAVKEPRMHKIGLLDLILAHCEEVAEVQQAESLAWTGVSLARSASEPTAEKWLSLHRDPFASRLTRAYRLAGNASRLKGDWREAERCFDSAAISLGSCLDAKACEKGLNCRSLALLRWDQNRPWEVVALLRHAAERFKEGKDREEAGTCFALLGLLHVEEDELQEALGPLLLARLWMNHERRPWLTARTAFALAFCLAAHGRRPEANEVFGEAVRFYEHITDPLELLAAKWLHGRVAAWVGEPRCALSFLETAREGFLANWRLAEATLVSLELALVYVRTGNEDGIQFLAPRLEEKSAGLRGRDVAVHALQQLAAQPPSAVLGEFAASWARTLRTTFRIRQIADPVMRWL